MGHLENENRLRCPKPVYLLQFQLKATCNLQFATGGTAAKAEAMSLTLAVVGRLRTAPGKLMCSRCVEISRVRELRSLKRQSDSAFRATSRTQFVQAAH